MKHYERIRKAFLLVLPEDEVLMVTPTSTMDDLPSWDSLNFIDLVLAIENEFDVELTTLDAASLTSFQAISDYLDRKGC